MIEGGEIVLGRSGRGRYRREAERRARGRGRACDRQRHYRRRAVPHRRIRRFSRPATRCAFPRRTAWCGLRTGGTRSIRARWPGATPRARAKLIAPCRRSGRSSTICTSRAWAGRRRNRACASAARLSGKSLLAFELVDGFLVYAMGINAQRDLAAARRLIERRIQVDAAALADPSAPVGIIAEGERVIVSSSPRTRTASGEEGA